MRFILSFLIVLLSFLFVHQANAQIQFGARGGIVRSSISDDLSFNNIRAEIKGGETGWTFGAVMRLKIVAFYLQPELLLTRNKYSYTEVDGSGNTYEERVTSLDLPVLLGLKFGPLRLNAGPEAHVNVNKNSDLLELNFYKDALNTFTVGWVGGIGVDLLGLMIDLRYHGNLRKVGTEFEIGNETIEFDSRPGQWSLTAGLYF